MSLKHVKGVLRIYGKDRLRRFRARLQENAKGGPTLKMLDYIVANPEAEHIDIQKYMRKDKPIVARSLSGLRDKISLFSTDPVNMGSGEMDKVTTLDKDGNGDCQHGGK